MHAQSEPNMIYALKTCKRYYCRPILARCVAVVSPSMRNARTYHAHSPREALLHLTSERRPTVSWLKSESGASASHLLPLMPPKVKKAAHRAASAAAKPRGGRASAPALSAVLSAYLLTSSISPPLYAPFYVPACLPFYMSTLPPF